MVANVNNMSDPYVNPNANWWATGGGGTGTTANVGVNNMSTTTPTVAPKPATTTTPAQPTTVASPTNAFYVGGAPLGSQSLTPTSAVTSSAPARTATIQNISAAADLANRMAYDQNELARKKALEAETAAKAAADAAKAGATSTTTATSRTDGMNATDSAGNRVYIANPELNQTGGFKFDDERYNPKSIDVEKNTIFEESMKTIDENLKKHQEALDFIASGADPAEKQLLQGISESYARRAEAMKQLNKARIDSMGTMGIRSGRARYASELQDSIIGQEEAAGQARIQELHSQEMAELNAAQQAYRTRKYDQLAKTMASLEKAREEKSQLIQQQFENTNALERMAIEKSQEERAKFKYQMERDAQIKEDAFAGYDKMIEAGITPDEQTYNDLAEATGMDKATLIAMAVQHQKEKQLEQQKMELALSLDRSQIRASDALTSQRLAGIVTSNVMNAAKAKGMPDDQIAALGKSNLSESAMLALIANYQGGDILTNANEYGSGEKVVYNRATGTFSAPSTSSTNIGAYATKGDKEVDELTNNIVNG